MNADLDTRNALRKRLIAAARKNTTDPAEINTTALVDLVESEKRHAKKELVDSFYKKTLKWVMPDEDGEKWFADSSIGKAFREALEDTDG